MDAAPAGATPDEKLKLSGSIGVVVMMGLLAILPTLVLMMTGFTRILIVLHFLKQAIGTQTAPPGYLIGAMSILLTGFVMSSTLAEANRVAIDPWLNGQIEQAEMLERGVVPFAPSCCARRASRIWCSSPS
jgi:flagellar biosynthetic protein FliP